MELTDKFCYIMGCFNFTDKRLREIMEGGFGITQLHLLKIDWWYSPSYLVIFERGKPSIISVSNKPICCDICNGRCKRGRGGVGMNECVPIKKKINL
jgi:hypothetical protein